jgi:hypothetical protein
MADNFYGKGIPLTSGFNLNAKLPLDLRTVVNSVEERDAYVTNNVAYFGMEVFVVSEQKKYMYNGTEWKELLTDVNNEDIDLSSYAKLEYVDEKHYEVLELKADKEHKHEEYLFEIPMEFVEDIDFDNIQVDFNELATKGDIFNHRHDDDYVLKEDMHEKPNFNYLVNMIDFGLDPEVITEGDYPDLTITLNIPGFSGSYNDLSDQPLIPDKTSQLENDLLFVTQEALDSILEEFASNADLSKYVTYEELIQMDYATVSYVDKQIAEHEHMVISDQEVKDILDEI